MTSDRRAEFVREITRWTNAQRAADQVEAKQIRERIASTDGFARLKLLRHAAIAGLRRYYHMHPSAEIAPALIVLVCALADNDDGAATASVETLARVIGRSSRRITSAIGSLCDAGIITREQRSGSSSRLAPVIAPAIARDPAAPVAWWTEIGREPLTLPSPLTVASGVTDGAATPDVTERQPLTAPSPNIANDIRSTTSLRLEAREGERRNPVDALGTMRRRPGLQPLRLATGWDAEAVEVIEALGDGPVPSFLAAVCTILQPPVGAVPVAWIRNVASRLAGHNDRELAALANRTVDQRRRDVPSVSDLNGYLAEISAALDATRARTPRGAPLTQSAQSRAQTLLTIRDSDPSWNDMIAHARMHLGDEVARVLIAHGTMQATGRWPRPDVVIISPLAPAAETSGAAA